MSWSLFSVLRHGPSRLGGRALGGHRGGSRCGTAVARGGTATARAAGHLVALHVVLGGGGRPGDGVVVRPGGRLGDGGIVGA